MHSVCVFYRGGVPVNCRHCTLLSYRGADISFLSVYPGEKEALYPPLTYLVSSRFSAGCTGRVYSRHVLQEELRVYCLDTPRHVYMTYLTGRAVGITTLLPVRYTRYICVVSYRDVCGYDGVRGCVSAP